jgi:hypothetical protein
MWRRLSYGLALAGLLSGAIAFAQNTNSGDIRGTVTDQTGAVIPGVTITVQDVDKNVTRTFTTDGAGLYDTGSIVPDHYLLTFSKSGFKTLVRGPITLTVGIQGVNAQLAVGSAEQKVVVTTNVPLLQTETGAQEDTLTAQTMDQLPQVGADWENFIWLQPGTAGTPENSSSAVSPNGGQVSVNGNLPYETYQADGATTTLPMSQNSDVTVFETTAEVKISDNAFSAQYGIGNTVYNQITKGGTDHFHGEGYEYFQNNAMDAVPYDFGNKAKVPVLRYNNYGFNVGGPVLRRKMFFFFDYDNTIDNGGASIGFTTVPNSALEGGNFTGAGLPTLYDPTTQTIQQTGTYTYTTPSGPYTQTCPCVIRKTFVSEYGTNAIPGTMIDPVAKAIQTYFPGSNTAGTITSGIAENNFTYNTPSTNPFKKYFGRLDWDITPSNRLTMSETESDNPATYLNQGICPINCQNGDVSRDNAEVSDVWSITPNLINEVRMGFTDQLNFFTPYTINLGYPGKLGWQFAKADNFPNIGISNFYGLGSQSNAVYKEFVFDPSDVVSLIHGRQVLHFGGEFLINRADSTAWGNINAGSMNYNGDYTSMNGQTAVTVPVAGGTQTYASGIGYADFLLGQTQSWGAGVTPEFGGRWKSPQLFVQDDVKIRPSLTVNLGLRYEIETGWSEVKGNEAVFDPTVINPANGQPGAIWYGFSHANGRTTLQAPKYDIVLPRVGFSWELMRQTVLRGGFGVYAASWSEDTYGAGMGNAFGSSGSYSDNTNGLCPVVQLDGTGAAPDTADPGCGTASFNPSSIDSKYLTAPSTPDARNNQTVSYNEYHSPVPTNYEWSLGVQRQFGLNYVTKLTYVGNHGSNLNLGTGLDINQVPENKLGPNDVSSEPYPLFQQIQGSTNNGVSNYNALQAEMTKRFSQGFELSANYTWSHFLDDQDSSGWGSRGGWQNYQNAFNPADNYSNSNFDIRNMFKAYGIYDLPFGTGRPFLNHNEFLNEVIGGWQLASTLVLQGGNPLSITTGNNNSSNNQSGSYTQFANRVGNYKLSGSTKSRLNEWYNLNAFAVPAPYTYGDFRRNIVYGPGLSAVNAQLGKTFSLWPEHGVQMHIEAEAFNVLNHPSFGQPGNNAIGPGQSAQITGVTVGGRDMMLYGKITF